MRRAVEFRVVIFISNLSTWPLAVYQTNKQSHYINALSFHLPMQNLPFQNMFFSSLVILTALISQSTFATGIPAPRAVARADGPQGDAHPVEPYLAPSLQASATPRKVNYPNVIRGLLFKRQLTCPGGYDLCDSGDCCPIGSTCCTGTIFNWPVTYMNLC